MHETLSFRTDQRVTVRDITDEVAAAVPDGANGLCHVFVPHTTAGITLNEAEENLLQDLEDQLESVVPTSGGFAHDRLDGNADAHLRSMFLGSSVTVPIREGSLDLGTWQRVLFVEGDGPRQRQVTLTILED